MLVARGGDPIQGRITMHSRSAATLPPANFACGHSLDLLELASTGKPSTWSFPADIPHVINTCGGTLRLLSFSGPNTY